MLSSAERMRRIMLRCYGSDARKSMTSAARNTPATKWAGHFSMPSCPTGQGMARRGEGTGRLSSPASQPAAGRPRLGNSWDVSTLGATPQASHQGHFAGFVRPGPTVRPASLPPAGQAGRRQFGSDRERRRRWRLETLQARSTPGADHGI